MTSVQDFATKSCATDVLQSEHLSWTYSIGRMVLPITIWNRRKCRKDMTGINQSLTLRNGMLKNGMRPYQKPSTTTQETAPQLFCRARLAPYGVIVYIWCLQEAQLRGGGIPVQSYGIPFLDWETLRIYSVRHFHLKKQEKSMSKHQKACGFQLMI